MKNKNPKVLLAAPTSDNKDYCFLDWYTNASTLTYPNYDILLIDNSHNPNYHKELKKYGVNVEWVNPHGMTNKEYITKCQNIIRKRAIDGAYDYFFSLETDIIPPRNVIEKLMSENKNIISVPYFIGQGQESNIITSYFFFERQKDGSPAINVFVPDLPQQFEYYNGQVNQSFSNGIGCTLIKTEFLEKFKFRSPKNKKGHSDTYLYEDIWNAKKMNFVDNSMFVKHLNSDWGMIFDHRHDLI